MSYVPIISIKRSLGLDLKLVDRSCMNLRIDSSLFSQEKNISIRFFHFHFCGNLVHSYRKFKWRSEPYFQLMWSNTLLLNYGSKLYRKKQKKNTNCRYKTLPSTAISDRICCQYIALIFYYYCVSLYGTSNKFIKLYFLREKKEKKRRDASF